MPEPFDLYTDAFTISVTPWGSNLTFGIRPPHPEPGVDQPSETIGVVRMSNEHLKVMVYLLQRQMISFEETFAGRFHVPEMVLAALGISLQDWENFWGGQGE
jgi:hypothetical protein